MNKILLGFLVGFTLAAALVLYGTDAWIKELETANYFLVKKLKEKPQ